MQNLVRLAPKSLSCYTGPLETEGVREAEDMVAMSGE